MGEIINTFDLVLDEEVVIEPFRVKVIDGELEFKYDEFFMSRVQQSVKKIIIANTDADTVINTVELMENEGGLTKDSLTFMLNAEDANSEIALKLLKDGSIKKIVNDFELFSSISEYNKVKIVEGIVNKIVNSGFGLD